MSPWRTFSSWRAFDRILAGLIVAMFLVFGFFGVLEHRRTDRLARQGAQAHDAICTMRADLERRVDAMEQYLQEHPEGFAGIPVAALRKSLEDQKRTIRALSKIRCDGMKLGALSAVPVVTLRFNNLLNCADYTGPFPTPPGDPNRLDADHDGVACETN